MASVEWDRFLLLVVAWFRWFLSILCFVQSDKLLSVFRIALKAKGIGAGMFFTPIALITQRRGELGVAHRTLLFWNRVFVAPPTAVNGFRIFMIVSVVRSRGCLGRIGTACLLTASGQGKYGEHSDTEHYAAKLETLHQFLLEAFASFKKKTSVILEI
jgi:hypothetical protein